MKDEIKEIEHIMICLKEHIALSDDEDTYLLDYITNLEDTLIDKNECIDLLETQLTNLQQELEIMVKDDERSQKTIIRLTKENERLKEAVENLTTMTVCGDRKQIKNTAQFKLEQCQSRIDKAIEYIKKEKENYLTKGCSIADTNNANLIVSAVVNTCDCSLNTLQNGSEDNE